MSNWLRALTVLGCVTLGIGVASPVATNKIPLPENILGFPPCTDYSLATYEKIADYFQSLSASTGRVQLFDIGRTTEGRTQFLAVISSEQNLNQLEHYKNISRSLALNRNVSGNPLGKEEARNLAREGKAIIWINFGLHSTEVANVQSAPWLAWKIAAGESLEIRKIREDVIFVLVPDMNPDGTTMIANWYNSNMGTPWETRLPWPYQRYAGHDNNRDWFMFTQLETRNIARQLYKEFLPQIVYDHHQAPPFPARIFIPPFAEPSNDHIPTLVIEGVDKIGQAIKHRLAHEKKSGAISRIDFNTWWNGGMRTAPYFHNMIGILTETAHASATPTNHNPITFPKYFHNGKPTLVPSSDYPLPYKGGAWTIRDSCDYMVSASMAVLDIGSKEKESWLYNIYRMAKTSMEMGAKETYVIPAKQWDPGAAVHMVRTLQTGGVEIERATEPFRVNNKNYQVGSFVIKGSQPFLPYIRDLLNPQSYPKASQPSVLKTQSPYDVSGWTLNLKMGVRVDKFLQRLNLKTEPVLTSDKLRGRILGTGRKAYAIDPRTNNSFIAINRLLLMEEVIFRSLKEFEVNGKTWPAGTFVIVSTHETHKKIDSLAKKLGLLIHGLKKTPNIVLASLTLPRVGVYSPWGEASNEGWTRWLLEQYEFPYTQLRDQRIRSGKLRGEFDVLILPDATYNEIVRGFSPGTMPSKYVGGMTPVGVEQIKKFVTEGGTLIAQGNASALAIRAFNLPVRNIATTLSIKQFNVPGTLLRVSVNNRHPLGWGVQAQTAAFFNKSPAFKLMYSDEKKINPLTKQVSLTTVASYPKQNLLLSGWVSGEKYLQGHPAVIDAAVGIGRIILLGFHTHHRGQSHATFKFLFNSIYASSTG